MKYRPAAYCLVLAGSMLLGPRAAAARDTASAGYLGLSWSLSSRRGSFVFPTVDRRTDTVPPRLGLFGIVAGKRYPLTDRYRLDLSVETRFASAAADTLYAYDPVELREGYVFIGCNAGIHLLPPAATHPLTPFALLGGGVDYCRYRERAYMVDPPGEEVIVPDLVDDGTVSMHLQAGAGLDLRIGSIVVSPVYALRWWRPVRYGYLRDFPLDAVEYSEEFFTHSMSAIVQLLTN